MTSEEVINKLFQKANREHNFEENKISGEAAFLSRSKRGARSTGGSQWMAKNQQTDKKFTFQCFNCHKNGHKASECPEKKKKK